MSHGGQSTLRVWARDLRLGTRFAFGGGREGWTRTLLTGVGVGLGVALLLITSAIPSAMAARDARGDARRTFTSPTAEQPGRDTLLIANVDQSYRSYGVDGRLVQPEGPDAPLPPGLKKFPGPGELIVSPALDRLMKTGEGRLLRDRLDGKIVTTIGDAGLVGPGDLYFYAGSDRLAELQKTAPQYVKRITAFENALEKQPLDPVLTLLVVLTFVALLMPVAVFIGAAVRFGGDRRDRRLAALRLVGADGHMVRRIAAGEAAAGSLIGLALGTGFFLAARQLAPAMDLYQRSVFASDLNPAPWLAALIALAVPAAAVAVTLFALRGVVIEPLGVVRTTTPRKRRIWWRLLLPLAGLGLLAPMIGKGNDGGQFNQWQVSGGVVLLLVGITVLLPGYWNASSAGSAARARSPGSSPPAGSSSPAAVPPGWSTASRWRSPEPSPCRCSSPAPRRRTPATPARTPPGPRSRSRSAPPAGRSPRRVTGRDRGRRPGRRAELDPGRAHPGHVLRGEVDLGDHRDLCRPPGARGAALLQGRRRLRPHRRPRPRRHDRRHRQGGREAVRRERLPAEPG